MSRTLIRFGVKTSILGGFIYYSKQVGVWGDPDVSTNILRNGIQYLKTNPYITNVKKQVPVPSQLQNLPSLEDISRSTRICWNSGVNSTFIFLRNLPTKCKIYFVKAVTFAEDQFKQIENASSSS